MNRLMLATLSFGICIPHHVLLAGWEIYSPSENTSYGVSATVSCNGEAAEEANYEVRIVINGMAEQTDQGTANDEGFWSDQLSPATSTEYSVDGKLRRTN